MHVATIAISTSSFGAGEHKGLDLLRSQGYALQLNPLGRVLSEDEIIHVAANCIGLIAGTEPLTRKVLMALPTLRVISRCGTGMDSVDCVAAKELGITVCSTPDGPTQAVAELTLALVLALLRNVVHKDAQIKQGIWQKSMGFLLQDKKIGLVGFGRIGRAVAKIFLALGCQVAYSDIHPVQKESVQDFAKVRSMPFTQLLAWANVISVHCTATGNSPLFTADSFAQMQNVWFINTARGELVDEAALLHALQNGQVCGAALDVFANEPYIGPLQHCENVILHPHSASYALEGRCKMEMDAVHNLLSALSAHT